jgi:hypothetical protein
VGVTQAGDDRLSLRGAEFFLELPSDELPGCRHAGMIFRAAGGTESIYNDLTREVIEIDGHNLELGPNIYIRPSTYTLGLTNEYGELLADPESYLEILNDKTNFDDFEHEFN